MKTIGCVVPDINDPTSLYRAAGPLSLLRNKYKLEFIVNASQASLSFIDMVFMQRPFNDDHAKTAERVKSLGIPLWVDYDDDILSVPTTNLAFPAYLPLNIKKNIAYCLTVASAVSVSTNALYRSYNRFNDKIFIIPNAYDKRYHGEFLEKSEMAVVWRGGWSHLPDLYEEKENIIKAANSIAGKKYTWVFVGADPWFITDHVKHNMIMTGGVPFKDYYDGLKKINPRLSIFPLRKTQLNICKSNCSWIETTAAGAVMVASQDFPEFRRPGVIQGFGKGFLELLEDGVKNELEGLKLEATTYIKDELSIERVNQQRERVIEAII
jgi:hypothetical protein